MKHITYISVLVSFIMYIACESPDHSQPNVNGDQKIETRDECEECPASNQCCCAVRLQEGELDATIVICASTSGLSNCTGGGGTCPSFNGVTYTFGLSYPSNPREHFCSLVSNGFSIHNTDPIDPAVIEISCQADEDNAQWYQVTIPPNTKYVFVNNGSCFISTC